MSRSVANALMLLVALIWGTTFVAQQLGMAHVGPLTYTGVRFLLGALFVLPLAVREYGRLQARGVRLERADWFAWCGLGVLLFLGAVFQQIGIMGTTVSNAGFLTALYVPMVPILAWLIDRHAPHPAVWPATIGSFIGTFMLSGGRFDALTVGDYWVIASTLFWAAHVFWVGRVAAHRGAPIMVAVTQFVVSGVLSMLVALAIEDIELAGLVEATPAILYGGLLSVGVAFTVQVIAQRHTPATDAAILLSSEILFAALAGALYLGERLTPLQLAGGGIIFVCILGVQVAPILLRKVAKPA
ncbi:DMT family transporter [Dechloromonas sp. CZR5]|uniref:DMT family transporter n=1 Tax=Dechloromonas sp. CZR5 TaxID=2608630 RepID=UPI00123CAC92|nr:DMT family transporter [Dechloromonas sp. CZR5]